MFGSAKGPVSSLASAAGPEMAPAAMEAPEAKSEYKLEDIQAVLKKATSLDEAAQMILDFLNGNEAAEAPEAPVMA